MLSSIQESFEKQIQEQGRPIRSSEDRNYLGYLHWKATVEGELFWRILHYSYALYSVYDYETLIRIFIKFENMSINMSYSAIYFIYLDYFDKKKGTLTDEGFKNLIKQIEKC